MKRLVDTHHLADEQYKELLFLLQQARIHVHETHTHLLSFGALWVMDEDFGRAREILRTGKIPPPDPNAPPPRGFNAEEINPPVATKGGITPTEPCSAANAHQFVRVPYTATYYFYRSR